MHHKRITSAHGPLHQVTMTEYELFCMRYTVQTAQLPRSAELARQGGVYTHIEAVDIGKVAAEFVRVVKP